MVHLTRRAFIKAGAVGTASLTILAQLEKYLYALEKSGDMYSFQREIRPFTVIPSICHQCQAGCGILGFVIDDELVGILGNPLYPNNKGAICTRAMAALNLVYDPERVLTPLKRKGKRGDNKWEKISWDQAIKEISSKLSEIKSKGIVVQTGVDDGYTPAKSILKKIGNVTLIDDLNTGNLNKTKGHELIWGQDAGVADVANSRYILNFGSNPYESHESYVPFVKQLISGRVDNNAKLVTFDVRLSNTAGRSDEWIPVRPGTDAAVILAMCNSILSSGLADTSFLNQWTNTSGNQLKNYLKSYTPEMAEKESGVPAGDIKRIANEFATQKPSVAFCGGGLTDSDTGTNNQMAILLLNSIIGNIDKKGGYCLPKKYSFKEPNVKSGTSSISSLIDDEKGSVGLYLSYFSNPVFSNTSGRSIEKLLKDEASIPYYLAVDTHVTETSKFADIILPATTHLESRGLDSRTAMDLKPYIGLRQPVIKPRGKAKSFSAILALIGNGIGANIRLNEEAYLEGLIKGINGSAIKSLKKNGFFSVSKARPGYKSYRTSGFKTRSGKLLLQSRNRGKSPLPAYQSIDKVDINKGKLYLTTFTKNVSARLNPNSKWLSEISHENPLWINGKTAERLGITAGDSVEIVSKGNILKVKVRITQMVHPEVAAISRDLGHWEYGNFAKGNKVDSDDDDTTLIWWKKDRSYHVNRLIKDNKDSISGGKGIMNTIVTIKKVG